MTATKLFIGLMSGTSLDGVDAVLADFSGPLPKRLAAHYSDFPPALREELLALQTSGPDELNRSARAANALVDCYATAVAGVLSATNYLASDITAIGAHGQTVRHQPNINSAPGYTIQLNNPARLAEATGITVVADFRSRDVAAGGQGAPLVPAFHHAVFAHPSEHRVIVNMGGMANLTDLHPSKPVCGWDTGPGNVLMDAWITLHQGRAYDADGAWGAQGTVQATLLAQFLADTFFRAAPPKSTGRDLFDAQWLTRFNLDAFVAVDVQATLQALTARSIADQITQHCGKPRQIMLCGGGAQNAALVKHLQAMLPESQITSTSSAGIDPQDVEALAFAWLAQQTLKGQPGNLPAVTGAKGLRVLGAIYPA